ncbi:DUF4148 domain-containing protein [Pandoraea sp. XJJ-1]|uniref:DUF4148 domain-containing protein n=1 Tax=unclassified Pandoraea TaxID=2624094 RepID=UPI000374FF59|nr:MULTISPECIES: DUF4148 domain-containing protein [unclassified Pandoraea]WAL84255.1 DUF4148 domain-containing protein [Pandoraea sp. XJJ-1]
MKSIVKSVIVACALAIPALSFAQASPTTRASVEHELVQMENAGYVPSASNTHYPDNIQAAEAMLQSQPHTASASSLGSTPQVLSQQSTNDAAATYVGS